MERKKKLTALILVLACALLLFSACGSSEDDAVIGDYGDSWEEGGNTLALATEEYEVAGVWSINDRYLYINPDGGYYIYATPEGRMGMGEYDNSNGAPTIIFNDYYYDLAIRQDGALVPIQNGEGYDDEESLDRITFFPDSADSLTMWNLSDLDGTWVDEYDEYIEIDSTAMQYSASSKTTSSGGTIADDYNGKGPFLSLNGYGYICPLPDMSGFTLQFVAGTYSEPDGSFDGTFYPDGGSGEITDNWTISWSDPGDTPEFGSEMDYISPDYKPHEINTRDDNGQRYHIEDYTAHVQTYCLMNMEPIDMYEDALVLTSDEGQYTFIRYITDEYYAFDGTDDEFAQYLMAKFCASDIINIYGGEAPEFELNYDAPGGDRIVSGTGYVYNDCMFGSVNICAYGGDGVYMLRMHVATGEYADDLLSEQIAVNRSTTYLG